MSIKRGWSDPVTKAPTGVPGLDEMTGGGLPRGCATLLVGGPGSGKTVLALQSVVNGARLWQEPAIFVAFEEKSERIAANAGQFGWDLPALQRKNLFFLNAQPTADMVQSGSFDLIGLLAASEVKMRQLRARRIVFDALDMLLELLADPAAERREALRLNDWLLRHDLTAIITAKAKGERADLPDQHSLGFMQFMVDCAVVLNRDVIDGVAQRNLRIIKYRGSSFAAKESPLTIGERGMEVAGSGLGRSAHKLSNGRVSSGIKRLDAMLGGGYYRGASILITGSPGTAKSTLGGAFAEAACRRGERTLFISYDSVAAELVRNLGSVAIQLRPFIRQGILQIVTARISDASAEEQFMRIKHLVSAHRSRNLVVDPISALAKRGNQRTAHQVVERLIDWAKAAGLTVLATSLVAGALPETENTPLEISTIADTWIHLSYLVRAGERNRALTIIKSRGTAHSNQVRELLLRSKGVTLSDVYTAGGEVLMGSLRWEKEQLSQVQQKQSEEENARRLTSLNLAQAELELRRLAIDRELILKQEEAKALRLVASRQRAQHSARMSELKELRGGDGPGGSSPESRR